MNPELFEQVTELFDAARRLPPAERTAFLDENCDGNEELRTEVESLLEQHEAASRLLGEAVLVDAARMPDLPAVARPAEETVRSRGTTVESIGPFKILEKLGEGGMGVVYLAEQTEPVRRRVALKVIKLGMDTEEVVARFEAERQALALMDHPNIARIFDAGATPSSPFGHEGGGRPYFVMEHVRGVPVTEYCDGRRLTLRGRLELFVQVCHAVQHAHLKGIIHRDIKPSNVLVSCPDDEPIAKIIDFGIAKATNHRLTEKTIYTQFGRAIGTPAYMSPEQAELTSEDIDSRTDIYSLGVLLYELIVGELPLDLETTKPAYDEIVRRIREEDPPTPSARWRKLSIENSTKLAERRRTSSTALARELRGDLDWITATALEKDRERRYPSAAHLAEDIGRHLRDEAILARAPSTLYQLKKFVRRNRRPLMVAAFVILTITLFAVLLTWRPWDTRQLVLTNLRRLTSDPGFSAEPSLSPDGKYVVYASDRGGGEGGLDLWIHDVETAEVRRLTSDPADDREPSISHDGTQVAFRSGRGGGGIYLIPTDGGERESLELVAEAGNRPRFSPDGKLILYWVGQNTSAFGGTVWLVEASGGRPRQIAPEMRAARDPVWSPDGRSILFLGNRKSHWIVDRHADWWIVPVEGGPARPTRALEHVPRGDLRDLTWPGPEMWSDSNRVVFSARTRDSRNLWSVTLSSRSGEVAAAPQLLSHGSEQGSDAWLARDGRRMVFAKTALTVDIWSLPLDANGGTVQGPPVRLTHDLVDDLAPYLSADGETLAFVSTRSDSPQIWLKDLKDGVEKRLAKPGVVMDLPVLSPKKTHLAYRSERLRLLDLATGREVELSSPQAVRGGSTPSDWSADGKRILLTDGWLVDWRSGQERRLVRGKREKLFGCRFSPDEHWITFTAPSEQGQSQVFVASVHPSETLGEDRWYPITDSSVWADKPCWSPDGNLLYFTVDHDGYRCIYAQRLDPETKRPLVEGGSLVEIQHFHTSRLSPMNISHLADLALSVVRDKIVFNLGELSGNIWTAELEEEY